MQITLVEDELTVAVRDYVKKMGITYLVGDIQFRATRGKPGSDTQGGVETTVTVGEPASHLTNIVEPVVLKEVPEGVVIPLEVSDTEEAADESIFG